MIAAVIQARMTSTRLPGKVLTDICGATMLERVVSRVRCAESLDAVIVATSTDGSDDAVLVECRRLGVDTIRGPLFDVFARYLRAVELLDLDHMVRITADCPLISPRIIDRVVYQHLASGADYTSNVCPRTVPSGLDVQVATADCLRRLDTDRPDREHVFPVVMPDGFVVESVDCGLRGTYPKLSVDTEQDLAWVRTFIAHNAMLNERGTL